MQSPARKKLRSPQAADYLGISPSTLAKWRMRGYGPPFHRCGPRIVLYFTDDLDAWLLQSRWSSANKT
jgi:predicted DNA-binding transcriptional regulator AlpA